MDWMQNAADLEANQNAGPRSLPKPTVRKASGFGVSGLSRVHARGSVLFSEGQPSQGVYLVRSGSAKLSISSEQGRVVILRVALPGDLLGVSAVLSGTPYEATAETLEPCRIDFITRSEFIPLHDTNKDFSHDVLHALKEELTELLERTRLLLLSETAAEKLARLLLKWADEDGNVVVNGTRVNTNFTHGEVAQMICTSRETVTRLFGEFSRRGLIQLEGNTILVTDRIALENVCRKMKKPQYM
jgi:CRP/FNR family cyclic AMP-dependent transcriptional regulator